MRAYNEKLESLKKSGLNQTTWNKAKKHIRMHLKDSIITALGILTSHKFSGCLRHHSCHQSELRIICCTNTWVTHPTRKNSANIFDLIVFTSSGTAISKLTINEELDNSDHYSIHCTVKFSVQKKICIRNLRRANWDNFNHLLSTIDWQRERERERERERAV